MTYILHIETATSVCSVALSNDGKLIALKDLKEPNVHAEQLTLLIQAVMDEATVSFSQLAAVSVSAGPGSYTGLRIGVSTAKGLCFALDIPLITVSTLRTMAEGMKDHNPKALLCPMIDARRMEIYTSVYRNDEEILPEQAMIIDEQSFSDLLKDNKMIFFGTGAMKCQPLLSANAHASFVDNFSCSAKYQPALAYASFTDKNFADLAYFEPHYLKEFYTAKKT